LAKIVISIDMESDFGGRFHTFRGIEEGLPILLKILEGIKCTFFVGKDAIEECPGTIKRLYEDGHEIACHSWEHTKLSRLREEGVVSEIKSIKEALLKLNIEPKGFRCPYFMIPKNLGMLLPGEDFLYDSSVVNAILPFRYNGLQSPKIPYITSANVYEELTEKEKELAYSMNEFYKHLVEIPVSAKDNKPLTLIRWETIPVLDQDVVVVYLHLHDLIAWPDHILKELPFFLRVNYRLSRHNPAKLVRMINEYEEEGFTFVKMEEILNGKD